MRSVEALSGVGPYHAIRAVLGRGAAALGILCILAGFVFAVQVGVFIIWVHGFLTSMCFLFTLVIIIATCEAVMNKLGTVF